MNKESIAKQLNDGIALIKNGNDTQIKWAIRKLRGEILYRQQRRATMKIAIQGGNEDAADKSQEAP